MKEFIKKFLGFSLGPIVGAIIGFITIPVTSYLVSADQFGLSNMFTLANNIITLIVLIGIDQAFIREYNETKNKKKLLFNSLIIPFVATIIIGVILIVFKSQFAQMLFNDYLLVQPIILLAVCTPLFIIEKFMLLTLRMKEKAFQYSLWSIMSKLLNLVLTIILLMVYKRNFESIVYASIFSQLITSIILIYICRKEIGISINYIDKKEIKSLIKFGFPLVPANIIGWGLTSTDSIFLRIMTTYTELGYYSVALKISNVLGLLQSSFTSFWTPLAFKWKAEGEKNEKFELVNNGVALVMSSVFIIVLTFKEIIPIFFGNGYEAIIYIFPFLLFHPIFYTMSETTALGIYFSKKTSYNIVVSLLALITNLILNYLLIPIIGAIGAAIATGISYLIFFWTRTIISRKLWFKFDIKKFIFITIILVLCALANSFIYNIITVSIIILLCLVAIFVIYRQILNKFFSYIKLVLQQKNITTNKGG